MSAPSLGEQYQSFPQRHHALRFGMWSFLASELLLFAGLFALYAAYRTMYSADFEQGIRHNTLIYGTINTYVLLTSSLTAVLSVHYARAARPRAILICLLLTILQGLAFLCIKALEYRIHYRDGALPGGYYHHAELATFGANRFYTLYWVMTGLHALHVIGGLGVLTWLSVRAWQRHYTPEHHTHLEMGTLYWHLIDVIWIFLWPLLYLT